MDDAKRELDRIFEMSFRVLSRMAREVAAHADLPQVMIDDMRDWKAPWADIVNAT